MDKKEENKVTRNSNNTNCNIPGIDSDFQPEVRELIIKCLERKYGKIMNEGENV